MAGNPKSDPATFFAKYGIPVLLMVATWFVTTTFNSNQDLEVEMRLRQELEEFKSDEEVETIRKLDLLSGQIKSLRTGFTEFDDRLKAQVKDGYTKAEARSDFSRLEGKIEQLDNRLKILEEKIE